MPTWSALVLPAFLACAGARRPPARADVLEAESTLNESRAVMIRASEPTACAGWEANLVDAKKLVDAKWIHAECKGGNITFRLDRTAAELPGHPVEDELSPDGARFLVWREVRHFEIVSITSRFDDTADPPRRAVVEADVRWTITDVGKMLQTIGVEIPAAVVEHETITFRWDDAGHRWQRDDGASGPTGGHHFPPF